jgi:hypothetical protein
VLAEREGATLVSVLRTSSGGCEAWSYTNPQIE